MKTFLTIVALMVGVILVAFGNDWGLLGLGSAFIQMVNTTLKRS